MSSWPYRFPWRHVMCVTEPTHQTNVGFRLRKSRRIHPHYRTVGIGSEGGRRVCMMQVLVRSPTTVCLPFSVGNWSCKAMSLARRRSCCLGESVRTPPKRGGLCIPHAGRHPTTGPQHTKLACALIITALSLERCMGLRSYLVGDSVSNIYSSIIFPNWFLQAPYYI
jgi:hypothetical protein